MSSLTPTPGQTIGPFFHFALPFPLDRELVALQQPEAVRLHGYVRQGDGAGIQDALIEIRQADAAGNVPRVPGSMRRDGATFTGWGRSHTDPTGHYWFSTLEPGATTEGSAPFGGRHDSGLGVEYGIEGLNAYITYKSIHRRPTA